MRAEPERAGAVVLVPFPAQGHVTPMLQLARALAARGVAATVVVPDFVHRRMGGDHSCDVALESFPSAVPDDGGEPPGFASIVRAMEHDMPEHLEKMLLSTRARAGGVTNRLFVVDLLASWAVPVASRCGVPAVGFWPAMLASYRVVSSIPELLDKGFISESGIPILTNGFSEDEASRDLQIANNLQILPAELQLGSQELLPWLVGGAASQRSRFAFWLQILERAKSLRCVLVNSFPGESAAGDSDSQQRHAPQDHPQILPVGPLLNDHGSRPDRLKNNLRKESPPPENPSMWQADRSCIGWLDRQSPGSVIYVSFGSWVAPIGRDEINELALGLAATGRPFLWVLKDDPSWRAGLPDRYMETVAVAGGRGKVVTWAPQGGVLRHEAVGCYLTHCGWNSTLEAIQSGVPLLCYPLAGDQFINSAFIVRMWGIGVRLRSTDRSDVRDCIERIMGGEDGRRLREKVEELRERVVMGETRCVAKRNLDSFAEGIKIDDLVLASYFVVALLPGATLGKDFAKSK